MLPRFSGEEVLHYIRTNDSLAAVPVNILSTNLIVDSAQEHLLESANQRIIKSHCTPATLMEAIQKALSDEPA